MCKSASSGPECAAMLKEKHDERIHVASYLTKVMKRLTWIGGLDMPDMQCEKCVKEKSSPLKAAGYDKFEEGMLYQYNPWLCSQCGMLMCGPHALVHYMGLPSEWRAVILHMAEFKVWCFLCDSEVNLMLHPELMDWLMYINWLAERVTNRVPVITNIKRKLLGTVASLLVVKDRTMSLATGQDLPEGTNSTNTPNYHAAVVDELPRVRGLFNLGNTCFYNVVLQCLARTPFLLDVLKGYATKGAKFELSGRGSLTESLVDTLVELQCGGSVFSPGKLLRKLTAKCPQFAGAGQHDSHELLSHLLECVRSEDFKMYQLVILLSLGYRNGVDPQTVDTFMKEKLTFYHKQAADRLYRPEPVFRGLLESTITCLGCFHVSSRNESFLDLSLPVCVETEPATGTDSGIGTGADGESWEDMWKMFRNNSNGYQQPDEQSSNRLKTLRQLSYSLHGDWGSTLAPRYQCEDNECSIQSCLNCFTLSELMTGDNTVYCDACTERINGIDGEPVKMNAIKQCLIASPPAVLIVHLKRFPVGPHGQKISKAVTFPFVLDIAPFCVSRVKNLPHVDSNQKKLLYTLYGIVQHSGTMKGGHYVAYVKVRPQLSRDDPRWEFLPKGSKAELHQEALQRERELAKEQARKMTAAAQNGVNGLSSSSGTQTELLPDMEPPLGKWYYVSDRYVCEATEDQVLKAEAYLLFYERIF